MWSRAGSLTATLEEVLFVLDFSLLGTGAPEDQAVVLIDLTVECTSTDASPAILTTTSNITPNVGIFAAALDNLGPSNTAGAWNFVPVGISPIAALAGGTLATWARTGG